MEDAVEQIENTPGMEDENMSDRPEPRGGTAGRQSFPQSTEKFARLQGILREMFQLDRGDLDFGLYRIMNLKAAEIAKFLEDDLLPQVKEALRLTSDVERSELENQLKLARRQARDAGYDPDENPSRNIMNLNRRLAEMKKDADAETDVYNHLANFFTRYYSEGDFISQRRYSSGGRTAYLIPYDGEEVKLHWANSDQYYVKTTENYSAYAFMVGSATTERRVRFEIAAADNEKDNVKEAPGRQRRFVLSGGSGAIAVKDGDLVVRFEHRPLTKTEKKKWRGNIATQQGKINTSSVKMILNATDVKWRTLLSAPAPTDANQERTLLAKHVERYTAKNSFDYFIHKDLGGFLRCELDLYLNTTVLNLDDLQHGDDARLDRALARVRAIRHVGRKIIDFLAQLEDFQKQLWLKKKFVLETHWCITLDRVPEELYPEVSANAAQCEEWVKLFAVNEIHSDLTNVGVTWHNPPTLDFLRTNPHLVLDTRHFDRDFIDRLLAALSDVGPLDEQLDGLLVHGENFQALNLLQERYQGRVECVYIDPPYNTGDSQILYKNGYLRSSWLTLIANRLAVLPRLLTPDPVLYIAIDDFEMVNLAKLIDVQYPWLRREMIIVNHHPQGGKAKTLAHTHEYMLACVPTSSDRVLIGRRDSDIDDDVERRPFKRSGTAESNFRYGRPNSFYAILVNPDSRQVVGLEPPPTGDEYPKNPTEENFIRIYPLGAQGEERVWRRSYESCENLVNNKKLICSRQHTIYQLIPADERRVALFSNWIHSRYNAGTFGANLLSDIIGIQNPFPYPKSVHTVGDAILAADLDTNVYVMDYFAGSGTTGHAIIDLNRNDGGIRKYILVDIGHHFDTVMLPRMKKIIYSPDWKQGKPVSRKGTTQFFKYIRLESYDDTLDSIELSPESHQQKKLLDENPPLAEDYRLRYALSHETSSSTCLLGREFADPFTYTLSSVRDGLYRAVHIDLPETFNFLIGLRVESRRRIDGVLTVTGTDANGHKCLILWRNLNKTNCTDLDTWFDRNRHQFTESLTIIYVNGDNTLNAMQQPDDTWVVHTIEPIFRKMMFEECSDYVC